MTAPPIAMSVRIREALGVAMATDLVEVRDDSHLHAGHAGAREGGHYHVSIVSSRFDGLSRLARHRLVYDALSHLMQAGIHALAIEARSPHDS